MTKQPRDARDARSDPDVPAGMSIELLKDLHLLTREGQLNADARRKLKQIRHLVGLLKPALDDALARYPEPSIVDCGAGKSYLGALLYELVLGPAGRGVLTAIEARPELSEQAAERAKRFGQARFHVHTGAIAASTPETHPQLVTALHACDTATDDALVVAIAAGADHVAVVPCCQAEVARQLERAKSTDPAVAALFAHPLHRRELGSHLTNVVRALALQAHGYKVTVTELVGWEHSAKNELILGKRVNRYDNAARAELRAVLERFSIEPAIVRELASRGLDPRIHGVTSQATTG
ncbi:MAG TPA: SAM-dependent methyltransferase [Kofleriaceae bacterium]|jgi:protein-L-isoaspartate O-methyltransferase|nr:SAM-dependent methyltransferase [Kofleriaceae bacterium]